MNGDSRGSPSPPPVELFLDREGRWFHEDRPILHRGLLSVLNRHLVISEDHRVEVRVGHEVARVTMEDLPYLIVSAAVEPDGLRLRLNDESEERIPFHDLALVGDDALYASVKSGRYPARFLRTPYVQVASAFEEVADGVYALPAGGVQHPVTILTRRPAWPPST
jgi:hypothetical protein